MTIEASDNIYLTIKLKYLCGKLNKANVRFISIAFHKTPLHTSHISFQVSFSIKDLKV